MVIEPLVVEKLGFTVVGLEITTRPRSNVIPALWGQFAPRIDEVDAIAEPRVSYGVMENFDDACTGSLSGDAFAIAVAWPTPST